MLTKMPVRCGGAAAGYLVNNSYVMINPAKRFLTSTSHRRVVPIDTHCWSQAPSLSAIGRGARSVGHQQQMQSTAIHTSCIQVSSVLMSPYVGIRWIRCEPFTAFCYLIAKQQPPSTLIKVKRFSEVAKRCKIVLLVELLNTSGWEQNSVTSHWTCLVRLLGGRKVGVLCLERISCQQQQYW